jgi:hypothetical protein
MLRYVAVAALAAFLFSAPQAFAQEKKAESGPPAIGAIMEVEGSATLTIDGQKAGKPAKVKDYVHLNDTIEAGPGGRVLLLFIDDTQLTLSEKTKLKVDKYVFDPENTAANKASYNILQGTFQYVSGLIAKKKNPDVTIDTPYGTIGIRGTKLWAGTIKDAYGVHVDEGEVSVRNQGGEVIVPKGKGTKLKSRSAPPTEAIPWQVQEVALIAATVLLKDQQGALARMLEFQKGPLKLQMIKNFKGGMPMPGDLKNLVPGGKDMPFDIPGQNLPGQKKDKKKSGGGIQFTPSIPGFGR